MMASFSAERRMEIRLSALTLAIDSQQFALTDAILERAKKFEEYLLFEDQNDT